MNDLCFIQTAVSNLGLEFHQLLVFFLKNSYHFVFGGGAVYLRWWSRWECLYVHQSLKENVGQFFLCVNLVEQVWTIQKQSKASFLHRCYNIAVGRLVTWNQYQQRDNSYYAQNTQRHRSLLPMSAFPISTNRPKGLTSLKVASINSPGRKFKTTSHFLCYTSRLFRSLYLFCEFKTCLTPKFLRYFLLFLGNCRNNSSIKDDAIEIAAANRPCGWGSEQSPLTSL